MVVVGANTGGGVFEIREGGLKLRSMPDSYEAFLSLKILWNVLNVLNIKFFGGVEPIQELAT